MSRTTTDEATARALAALEAGRVDEARGICEEILGKEPERSDALHLLGIVTYRAGDLDRAQGLIERAIAAKPEEAAQYHRDLCEMLRVGGRLDAALGHGRRAVELEPEVVHGHYNLGIVHYDRLELDEAIQCQRRVLAARPEMAEAHFELAEGLLLSGCFAEGWEEYEWRFRMPGVPPLLQRQGGPLWNGEAAPQGTLLLIADQGFGDCIQFARLIPRAVRRVGRVAIACSLEMNPLIAQLAGGALLSHRWPDLPDFDFHCPLSSLPRAFKTEFATIPGEVPYLKADPARAERWRGRLKALVPPGYLRVGLVWAGRPSHGNDRNRSIPLALLAPLAELPGVALVALQKGPAQAQIGAFYGPAPLVNLSSEIGDFTDTAAILAGLDLVISVDTSVAHLAGAMAVPTWLLLPFAPDWRWLTGRSDSPWYPTMRLFRQPAPGDWATVVGALAAALRQGAARMTRNRAG